MKKTKILFIDIEGGFGGSSRSLLNIVLNLNKKQFLPIVLCKKKGPTTKKLKELNIKYFIEPRIFSIIPLKKNNIKNLLINLYKIFFINKVINKIIHIKPDLLHLNYEGLVPLHYMLMKKKFKEPTVLHFRSSVVRNNFLYKIYAKYINKYINYLIFITENQLKEAKKAGVVLKKDFYSVLYNSSYKLSIKPKRMPYKKYFNILYLGTIDHSRGVDRLIKLAEFLKNKDVNIKINIYGKDIFIKKLFFLKKSYSEYLKDVIIKKKISKIIKVHGFTSKPEDKLKKADLLIHPSRNNDPWSRTIIEAMALGVPVISHGQYNKFVKNNKTGFLLNEWNLKEYANLIVKLSSNKKKLKSISENAKKFAKENFNPKEYQFKIENIYKLIINKQRDN